MILIGSRALQHYIPLNRIIHDWDFMMDFAEFEQFNEFYGQFLIKTVNHTHLYEIPKLGIVEILVKSGFKPSDHILWEKSKTNGITTPFGVAQVPSFYMLYEMKRATAEFINEPKHHYDLSVMKSLLVDYDNSCANFYSLRYSEIKDRIEKSEKVKYDFFHKYHIPEYIKHDYLHEVIADLVDIKLPTYQKITCADTDIAEELFDKLTHQEKISLMVEESLVLALERWFVPQMVENGINFKLLEIFDNNNEGLPTYKILKHCCITGLKGEAEYITKFSRDNFFEIETNWIKYKAIIKEKGGLPSNFYDMLFKIREDYKQGKTVATV